MSKAAKSHVHNGVAQTKRGGSINKESHGSSINRKLPLQMSELACELRNVRSTIGLTRRSRVVL